MLRLGIPLKVFLMVIGEGPVLVARRELMPEILLELSMGARGALSLEGVLRMRLPGEAVEAEGDGGLLFAISGRSFTRLASRVFCRL